MKKISLKSQGSSVRNVVYLCVQPLLPLLCPGEQLGPGSEEPLRYVRHLRGPAEGQGDLQSHLRLHREERRRGGRQK